MISASCLCLVATQAGRSLFRRIGIFQFFALVSSLVGLISTAGGLQGLQAVNTMEFVVRALRGWAVPLVMPIAQAWKAFDKQGTPTNAQLTEQLHALGRVGKRILPVCARTADESRRGQSGK